MYSPYANRVIELAKQKAQALHKTNIKYFPCPPSLIPWIKPNNIYLTNNNNRKEILAKYSMVKGDYSKIQIINPNTIGYKDHVSRIYTSKTSSRLPDAIYTLPQLSNDKPIIQNITKPSAYINQWAKSIVERHSWTILTTVPEPFDYRGMETGKGLEYPVSLGYPKFLPQLSDINYRLENVLHLPIKISLKCETKFGLEQRVGSDGKPITHNKIYLPKELGVLADYIQLLAQIELYSNPYFKLDYYMFLSISDGKVEPGNTHRRGGWHIDGHQGVERLVKPGIKHLTDRQYILCDTLPTEFYPMKFDFGELIKSHTLDNINIQDQIEKMTAKQEELYPGLVSTIKPNQINFLTPYMVHRGQTNVMGKPIARKFIRLISSSYSRDRVGDTVNPIFGPINPMKIKTITDIYEVK
jgi:hypothetical protein